MMFDVVYIGLVPPSGFIVCDKIDFFFGQVIVFVLSTLLKSFKRRC